MTERVVKKCSKVHKVIYSKRDSRLCKAKMLSFLNNVVAQRKVAYIRYSMCSSCAGRGAKLEMGNQAAFCTRALETDPLFASLLPLTSRIRNFDTHARALAKTRAGEGEA